MKKAIVLTGGSNAEQSYRFARIIAANAVETVAVIASPRTDQELAEGVHAIVNPGAEVIYARKPGESGEVQRHLDGGVDLAFNTGFDYIVDKPFLDALGIGCVNAHPAALPLNRGCHFSFWGIMDGTPHGASIHWIDEGLDSGDIVDQLTFEDDGFMTAAQVMKKAEALCVELWEKNLPAIIDGTAPRRPQSEGSYHAKSEIAEASTLRSGDSIGVDRLLDLSRATSCKGNGFFIVKDGRWVLVRTQVEVIDEPENSGER